MRSTNAQYDQHLLLFAYINVSYLHLSISNDIVSSKIYDKRDDFDFEIVNFPFLDGDVPRSSPYGVRGISCKPNIYVS